MSEPKKKDETPARLSVPEQYRFLDEIKGRITPHQRLRLQLFFKRLAEESRKMGCDRNYIEQPEEKPTFLPMYGFDGKPLLKGK